MKRMILALALSVSTLSHAQTLPQNSQEWKNYLEQNPVFLCLLKPEDPGQSSFVFQVNDYDRKTSVLVKSYRQMLNWGPAICGKGQRGIKAISGINRFQNQLTGYVTVANIYKGLTTVSFPLVLRNGYYHPAFTGRQGSIEIITRPDLKPN